MKLGTRREPAPERVTGRQCDVHPDRSAVAHYAWPDGTHLWGCDDGDGIDSGYSDAVRDTTGDCAYPGAHLAMQGWAHPVAVLNTSIATEDGAYTLRTVTADEARDLIRGREILSAVGHDATAQALSTVLAVEVPVNRIQFAQQPGQVAVVLKLRGRLPEGQVLTLPELEAVGYDLKVLTRTA